MTGVCGGWRHRARRPREVALSALTEPPADSFDLATRDALVRADTAQITAPAGLAADVRHRVEVRRRTGFAASAGAGLAAACAVGVAFTTGSSSPHAVPAGASATTPSPAKIGATAPPSQPWRIDPALVGIAFQKLHSPCLHVRPSSGLLYYRSSRSHCVVAVIDVNVEHTAHGTRLRDDVYLGARRRGLRTVFVRPPHRAGDPRWFVVQVSSKVTRAELAELLPAN